ncbi:hypothetical protein DSCO28_16690 [Desulfosarcina ovata subsp. sediminis]|uniref:Dehydrogenase n=1 Tax=Desulfosarcina ovata subsp. sediminis TaxID=885957 RepID=A0A5K7ZRC1_9BACT|nr:molybdopterin-dependent oxidoreductase [Desulfosarcina ovata]BBO81103.1 hypothetical protein DSCO28_16690 [Desulfosarcina ovata subsp. sediminis]
MGKTEIKTTTCYGCAHTACFVKAHIEDGKLVKVTPDREKICVDVCTRGFLADNGKASIEYHYGDKRVNYPLKRAGKRGENKWKRISWDQALDEIAEKLQSLKDTYGPHSVCLATGTAHHSDNNWVPFRWMTGFRTMNKIGNEQICYGVQFITSEATFGWPNSAFPNPELVPKSMVIVGNVHETIPQMYNMLKHATQAGVELIVVDPRVTAPATLATHFLQIRPGTDIALWMCWLKLIIENEWFDKEFVYDWTNGPFLVRIDTGKILRAEDIVDSVPRDAFVVWNTKTKAPAIWDAEARQYMEDGVEKALTGEYAISLKSGETVQCKTAWTLLTERAEEWTPEKAAEVTSIPANKIVKACETYAVNTPGLFLVSGHCYDAFAPGSASVFRVSHIIKAIVGNMDRTEMLTGCYDNKKLVSIYEMELKPDEAFSEEEKKGQPGWDSFRALTWVGYDLKAKYEKKQWGVASNAMYSNQGHPHVAMWQELIDEKPDRTRAMILNGSNPMIKYGNTKRVYEAMKKLDLIVSLEFNMTSSAVMGDYVLPMSDWFERPEIGPSTPCDIFNFIHLSDAVMKPEFERRSDYDVFKGLAERLGFGDDWKWKDLTECYNWRAQGLLEEYGCQDIAEFAETVGFDYPSPIIDQYKIRNGFATPTAKTEIWSVMFEELGYDPLPSFVEPALSPHNVPELYKEYPLTLIGIDRHLPNYHSQFYEVPSLRKMCPEPIMDIHYDTARLMDPPVTDGDWVWIETRKGRIKQRARLTFGLAENCVKTTHHFWYPEMPGEEPYLHGIWESSTNVLTEDDPELCDPVFGTWPHTAIPCKVYKVVDGSHLENDVKSSF